MTNPYYNNTTNIILDGTSAEAADVENKCNDIVLGFDQIEAASQATGFFNITDATKGKLLAANGSLYIDFPVGTDGQVLSADSADAQGLTYVSHDGIAGLSGGAVGEYNHVTDSEVDSITDGTFTTKNVVQNGKMRIRQRGDSATTLTDGQVTADRWEFTNQDNVATFDYSIDTVLPPNAGGSAGTVLVTEVVGADPSPGFDCIAGYRQHIEGYNFAELHNQEFTVSFWFRSTATGTFGASILSSDEGRSYVHPFTVAAANTWQQVTFTLTHDDTGTWNVDETIGAIFAITFEAGFNKLTTTPDIWVAGDKYATDTQTPNLTTISAEFWIADVRVCKGTTTDNIFHPTITQELDEAYRYYWGTDTEFYANPRATTAHNAASRNTFSFPTAMRVAPTLTAGSVTNLSGVTVTTTGTDHTNFKLQATATAAASNAWMTGVTADAEF